MMCRMGKNIDSPSEYTEPANMNEKRTEKDDDEYFQFTGTARYDKTIHSLEGLVNGIAIDGKVNDSEINALRYWIDKNNEFANRRPFNIVIQRINECFKNNGIMDEEERADLIWCCNQFQTNNFYYDQVTSDMQRLHGLMGGISADGKITGEELENLQEWLAEHEHLANHWPYDELTNLLEDVYADGYIDDNEHQILLNFFSEFVSRPQHRVNNVPEKVNANQTILGVCATDPVINIVGATFCFTGVSELGHKKEKIGEMVEQFDGSWSKNLTQKVNYLVVMGDGNACWALETYGRKIEKAIHWRKEKRLPIVLIHEHDFWDAMQDLPGFNL